MTEIDSKKNKRSCMGCLIKGTLAVFFVGLILSLVLGLVTYFAYQSDIYPGFDTKSTPIVLRGGTLFDAVDGTVREPGLIIVKDGQIACIGSECIAPANSTEIDATGLTILPGLIDSHLHFGAPSSENAALSLPMQLWDYARQRPAVRRGLLEAGVTTIRSVGDVDDGIIHLRTAVESGELAGPRVFTTGPIITAWGGHPAGTHYRGNPWLVQHATRQVGNPKAGREAVREVAAMGADGIKTVYGGGSNVPRMGPKTLKAIVDEGHQQGLWVTVHTGSNDELMTAVNAGADAVEHGVTRDPIDDASIARMKSKGTVYVPTLAVMKAAMSHNVLSQAIANVARVHAADVPIVAGTDTQGPNMAFGTSLHDEIALLVEAGLAPTDALLAATRNGALLLRAEKELGTVEKGKRADLLLVKGKPWETIDDIRQVRKVIQGGVLVFGDQENSESE